jgi:hypothetical protein
MSGKRQYGNTKGRGTYRLSFWGASNGSHVARDGRIVASIYFLTVNITPAIYIPSLHMVRGTRQRPDIKGKGTIPTLHRQCRPLVGGETLWRSTNMDSGYQPAEKSRDSCLLAFGPCFLCAALAGGDPGRHLTAFHHDRSSALRVASDERAASVVSHRLARSRSLILFMA